MNRIFGILLILFITCNVAAQVRIVKGRVLDSNTGNEPLISAEVRANIKGSDKFIATVTDLNGNFSFNVTAAAHSLNISHIGYNDQTVELKNGVNEYVVYMTPSSQEIEQVVITTGYQNIDRRKLTSAVTTVDISDEKVGAVKNIDQALAGQVAGLSSVTSTGAPGAPVKIRIRGTASINGTQEPLWVLDGIPLEGTDIPVMEELYDIDEIYQTSIAGVNPADIESITVLKDAAATAIYGARAANGVIVITTRKGEANKQKINFSSKFSFSPKTDIGRLNLLNADEKVDLELSLLRSDYTYRENKGSVATILANLGMTDAYKNGGWDAISAEAQEAINRLRGINTDWNDILFRPVFNQEYNLSLSGGNGKASYYTSLGYYDEKGNVKGVENNRFNATLKIDYNINSHLKLGASLFANQRKQKSFLSDRYAFTNPMYYSRMANPYQEAFDKDGNYVYDTNVQGRETAVLDYNIFEERANTSKERTDQSIMAILNADLFINDMFNVTSQFGLQVDNYILERYAGENSYAMRKEKNLTSQLNSDGEYSSLLPAGGMNRVNDSRSMQWTWKTMLEYSQRFARKHEVEAMAGMELRHAETSMHYSAAYGYDNRTLTSQPVIFPTEDWAERYPLYSESFTENAYVSWFATASYTYDYRYTLGGSVRFDGSDVFGVSKKYRYLPLWSVSALWHTSEEKFMKELTFIDNLSFRASYGLQGNIDKQTSPYLIGIIDKTTILPGNIEDIIETETAPNPYLRWEKTQNINIGTDISLFNNAISLTVDYYYRKSTDLIGMKQLALESGFSSTVVNWAAMENRGWEIALATRNIYNKDFRWTTNINLGLNENKVLDETVAENATYPGREGYPVGAIFAYKTAGLDEEGYPMFVNKNGEKVSATDFLKLDKFGASTLSAKEQRAQYTYMGTSDPKISGGFINTFEYKNWTLGINYTFNLGMTIRTTPSYSATYFDRGLNTNKDILDRWSVDNPNGKFPVLMTSDRGSEYLRYAETSNLYNMLDLWVKDCDYFRLQSIRLGYNFDEGWLKRFGIRSASLSFEARNLFVLATDYDNYLDPETMGNPYAQPIPKSFIVGVNVNF